MIVTNIEKVRDPFVLVEDNAYYVYGTNRITDWRNTDWICYKNTDGKLDGEWKILDKPFFVRPQYAETNFWAPEVHKYNGSYYMFATYFSSLTKHRGCSILKADSPEGPFVEITDGLITPADWDAIDGTLYVDEDGQPWMVFVHEWTSMEDGIGSMAVAKLSDDFTHFISEPVELFKANDPMWTDKHVTDGCFMYKTKDDALLMIWSNEVDSGYCVGIARCVDGNVCGKWEQEEKLLFSREIHGEHDGGHGMIFNDRDGRMYLCVHAPNVPKDGITETPVFIPLKEKDGTLVCEI